jgi:hypothetical protein
MSYSVLALSSVFYFSFRGLDVATYSSMFVKKKKKVHTVSQKFFSAFKKGPETGSLAYTPRSQKGFQVERLRDQGECPRGTSVVQVSLSLRNL